SLLRVGSLVRGRGREIGRGRRLRALVARGERELVRGGLRGGEAGGDREGDGGDDGGGADHGLPPSLPAGHGRRRAQRPGAAPRGPGGGRRGSHGPWAWAGGRVARRPRAGTRGRPGGRRARRAAAITRGGRPSCTRPACAGTGRSPPARARAAGGA